MQTALERPSAQVIPFPVRRSKQNRLTPLDRIQAMEWDFAKAAPAGARLSIHDRQPRDAPEVGDYIGIYRANDRWAVWGAARNGPLITVWHGPSGTDLGSFTSMKEALAAVSFASIQPRTRRQS